MRVETGILTKFVQMNEKKVTERKFMHEIFVKISLWKLRLIRDNKYLCAPLNSIVSELFN